MADGCFPSGGFEKSGHFVGMAEDIGDALTYYILMDDTHQIIPHSVVQSALDPQDSNLWALPTPDRGEAEIPAPFTFVQSITDHLPPGIDPSEVRVPKFAPQELSRR